MEGLAMERDGIFVDILSILRPSGIFYGRLVHSVVIWYILVPVLVCCTVKKSGNPACAATFQGSLL
jgi:hypothetical protein